MFVFIRKAFIFRGDLLTKPKIETEAFELFFPTCLIETFFSWATLVIEASLAFLLVLLIQHFLVRIAKLLASSHILNLL